MALRLITQVIRANRQWQRLVKEGKTEIRTQVSSHNSHICSYYRSSSKATRVSRKASQCRLASSGRSYSRRNFFISH